MRLKKLALTFIICVVYCCLANAQEEPYKNRTYLGVKGGYNYYSTAQFFHSLQTTNIAEGFKQGLNFGVVGINYLEKNIGFQVEVNYTQKGWVQLFDSPEPRFNTQLDYIEVPLYLNIYIGKKKTRLYINMGCYFEYLLNVSMSELPSDTQDYDFYPYDTSRDRKMGYGLIGGGGIYRDFSFGTIILQSTIAFGISNVLNPVTLDSGVPNISNLITSTVSLGYMIKLGE